MTGVLKIGTGDLQLEIWALGARLNNCHYAGVTDLVASASSEAEALGEKKYFGAVVGPVANRIAGGKADLDGVGYAFERNENDKTTLHSGSAGVHAREWEVVDSGPNHLNFRLLLGDGDGGFPGNRGLTATYLAEPHGFTLDLEATTDAPTWVNLALHPYWSLGVGREGLQLKVNAARYLPVDADKIPLGHAEDATGTLFDLGTLAKPSSGIDHNYCLTDPVDDGPAATLVSDRLRLDIETDAPGLQIYSGKDIGIAIEPQHWPDAMHHPDFPPVLLSPRVTWRQTSTYRFSRL